MKVKICEGIASLIFLNGFGDKISLCIALAVLKLTL